jgi:hypothetical protein
MGKALSAGLLFVFVLLAAGCDNGYTSKDILDGTRWEATFEEDGVVEVVAIEFNRPNFLSTENGENVQKGTYILEEVVEGDNITFLLTHDWTDGQWVEARRWGTANVSGDTLTMGPPTFRYNLNKVY